MAKHTPGPWEIDDYGDIQANGEDVAHVCSSYGLEENEANTALIAAAPELLEALMLALPFLEEYCDSGPDGEGWKSDDQHKAIAAAVDAINKATGAA